MPSITFATCASSPPGKTYSSTKSPMPLPRLCAPSGLCVIPWFSTSPPGFRTRWILPKYFGKRATPTCSNMPTLAILS